MSVIQEAVRVTAGFDTHRDCHVGAVFNTATGRQLGTRSFPASPHGYRDAIAWIESHGLVDGVGVESTGSYGAGFTRHLLDARLRVVEVDRPDRKTRRFAGKTDTVDAVAAGRAVLAGQATGQPKRRDGDVEAIRQLDVVRSAAMGNRTRAINNFHSLVVTASDEIRGLLEPDSVRAQLETARGWAVDHGDRSIRACQLSLRELALLIEMLTGQIDRLDREIADLAVSVAPALCGLFGVGPFLAARLLLAFGPDPARVVSSSAFAKLAGSCPIPASSGKTSRHRLNRGGDRRANNALYTITIVRMRYHAPSREYVKRRTAEGKTKREIMRCLKRYIAREVYQAVVNPPGDIPTGEALRGLRLEARLRQIDVAGPNHTTVGELGRLERGRTRNTELAYRLEKWYRQLSENDMPGTSMNV